MKYVMFKKKIEGQSSLIFVPVTFPNLLVHSMVAESLLDGPLMGYEVHSAGDVSPSGQVGGTSTSLNVGSDPEDARRIRTCDYANFEEVAEAKTVFKFKYIYEENDGDPYVEESVYINQRVIYKTAHQLNAPGKFVNISIENLKKHICDNFCKAVYTRCNRAFNYAFENQSSDEVEFKI